MPKLSKRGTFPIALTDEYEYAITAQTAAKGPVDFGVREVGCRQGVLWRHLSVPGYRLMELNRL